MNCIWRSSSRCLPPRMMAVWARKLGCVAILTLSLITVAYADEREQFFETQVRPLLAQRCFECHGPETQEAELRLDRREAGAAGQQAVVSVVKGGDLSGSRLWQAVQYDQFDAQMPPAGKLPASEIEILKKWIEAGAYWPEESAAPSQTAAAAGLPRRADGQIDFEQAARNHWAFRPLAVSPAPAVEAAPSAIDAFILSELQAAGVEPSPPANREQLIRRLSIGLLGVPAAAADVEEFVQDARPDALDRLLDRLLGSPLYGERWARVWLDVARYADTKGYVFQENRFFPHSYTYRDYVIRAANDDTPYDQFVLEQLAADQLGYAEDDPRLAALGFLTVGPAFLNNIHDQIDDRIDVVSRGLMGLTVACARCHDHKYDPIPTVDYYALYGVFNSSHAPAPLPLIGRPDPEDPAYQGFLAELQKRRTERDDFIATSHRDLVQRLTAQASDYVLSAGKAMGFIAAEAELPLQHGAAREKLVAQMQAFVKRQLDADHPVFVAWKELLAIPTEDWSARGQQVTQDWLATERGAPAVRAALEAAPAASPLEVLQRYGALIERVAASWAELQKSNPEATELTDDADEEVRRLLFGPGSLTDVPGGEHSPIFERDQHERLRQLQTAIDEWDSTSPDSPPRAMVLVDKPQPVEPVVFLRGDARRPGPKTTRHFPQIVTHGEAPFQKGSGRLELAEQIVDEDNPLTARVIVNRVWRHHFGAGLVATASDFGLRGEPPTHPALLDHLAQEFIHRQQWSLKALHRRILLSAAYQQSSVDRPEARAIDSENRLLWRQNRQRLDFESMRDSLLLAAGRLQLQVGGRPVNIEADPLAPRRTVYALVDRNNLPGLFRTFDFPSPDATSPGRPLTTVPQQSLYVMNSQFVAAMADSLAARAIAAAPESSPGEQAQGMLRLVYGRAASPAEAALLSDYAARRPLPELAQALLMTNEFLFVD